MAAQFKRLPVLMAAALLTSTIAGCNLFGFASDDESTPLETAENAIRTGNYADARKALTDENGALRDSTDSMVLYTYSKAVLLESGLTIARIVDLVENDKSTSASGNLALLEEIDSQSDATKTSWYQANSDITLRLARIWNGKTSGELDKDDIALDYSVANIMSGVLSLRDTNRDNRIDSRDFQIQVADIGKMIGGGKEGFGFNGIVATDETTGETVTFNGLTAFLGTATGVAKAARAAGVSGYSPDDINPLIARFFEFLATGESGVSYLIEMLNDSTSLDPAEIRDFINNSARIVNYYWYDDDKDNDGDGRVDEEIIDGIDNDGDGLVDEDSDYMSEYDSTNTANTQYHAIWEQWSLR